MGTDLKEATEQKLGYGELHLHLDGAITPDIARSWQCFRNQTAI